NPEPEIRPELAKEARPDCLIGTGRSDYPNQVNNSLCFPFIFRGALDCGASTINEEMKLAAVRGLAELARAEPSEIVALAYGEQTPPFGPDYLIPRAFDPRLITKLAPAVAKAAMDSGGARRPLKDRVAYHELMRRKGVSRAKAMDEMRSQPTLVGAMLVRRGEADAMLCGTRGDYADHLKHVRDVIGLRGGVHTLAAMQMLILPGRQLFVCDTHVNGDPDADAVAEMTLLAAEQVQRFGLKPSVALLSHSSFGGSSAPSAQKMRDALAIILANAPTLAVEGEVRA